MDPLTLRRVAEATGGRLLGAPAGRRVRRVVTDSRDVRKGDLFVCLEGPRFDGHDYAGQALAAGAAALLVHREPEPPWPAVVVEDTLTAFGAVGRAVRQVARRHADPLVVAITGSNGKTATKDLTAAALARSFATVAARKSFNNAVGVPITLCDIERETGAVVVEVGTNGPGEIAALTSLVEPEVAVITNVNRSHLAGLRDLEGVLAEKGSILDGLVGRKVAVLCRDDASFEHLARRAPGEVLSFGTHPASDVLALDVRCAANGTRFRLADGRTVALRHLGRHSVLNALAALAVAQVAGVDPLEAAGALADVPPPPGRLNLRAVGRVTVLDDSYNANPASLGAAATALTELGLPGRRVLVVGDMLELGADATSLHRAAGRTLAGVGASLLVAVGTHAHALRDGAVEAGLDPGLVAVCATRQQAATALSEHLQPGDVVLIKGSRGMALDSLVGSLDVSAAAAS